MIRSLVVALLLTGIGPAFAGDESTNSDKVPSRQDFGDIQREVETLRGKSFKHPIPVYQITSRELRAISDRDLDKQYPGAKLASYTEMLEWLDVVPPHTDLKSVYADFYADQVAGLYDSDAKEMCIPVSTTVTNVAKKATEKKLAQINPDLDGIVLAHEFTHALEDQYWPMDDPMDTNTSISTDRGTAHSFVAEGSATREMTEAAPAQWGGDSPRGYFFLWNAIHSSLGEFALNLALASSWKSADVLTPGVPPQLARTESMPYSFGYAFCTRIMRDWGLDGLDYIYDHPPVSTTQVMHPAKAWEWRDFPVQIDLPESLPGDWKQISLDTMGEAGIAVMFGCQFSNLNYGLDVAQGWAGDHVALFAGTNGHRLLFWVSSWHSTNAAGNFASTLVRERTIPHQAVLTKTGGDRTAWESPDGRTGILFRDGKHVTLIETDDRTAWSSAKKFADQVVFKEPPEDAARAAINRPLRRFNPFWAWQKDGDYVVTRSLYGLLSRHDRNRVGAADTFLLGLLGETRRTKTFHKWELIWGLLSKHESDSRRGITTTTLLPWGVLASHDSARLPQTPDRIIARISIVWGLGGSVTRDGNTNSLNVLPFGLLLHQTTALDKSSFHILGTGVFHQTATANRHSIKRYRLLGLRIWTVYGPPKMTG